MPKRKIVMLVIFFGTILQFIFANFVFKDFPAIISFVLLVPFYLIVYLYYQRYRYIKWIAFISIFTLLANLFMLDYLSDFQMYSSKIRLIGMVSFFGCLINNFLAFILLLQPQPKSRTIKLLVLFIVLINYFFFSYYIFSFTGILVAFFGPSDQAVNLTVAVVQVLVYIFQFAIMIVQMILVKLLGSEEEYYLKAQK
ncbi:MAG: hypothetical protein JEZ05_07065 [Tenericutes bacterium]|nr:hypothetical protein [Mycoplasmatota bacterium]